MPEERGVEEIAHQSAFTVNEEVNLKNNQLSFSISGKHVVTYEWFRVGPFKTREDAEKKVKELTG